MATAAPQIDPTTKVHSTIPSIVSGWEGLAWTRTTGFDEKLFQMLCDISVVLVNGLWLPLLLGTRMAAGMRQHIGGLLLYAGLTVLACASMNLYDGEAKAWKRLTLWAVAKPIVVSTLLFAVFLLLQNANGTYWVALAAMAASNIGGLATWRAVHCKLAAARITGGNACRRTLIIGAGQTGKQVAEYLEEHVLLGYTVKGFLDDRFLTDPAVLGPLSQFSRVVRSEFIDEVFIADTLNSEVIQRLTDEAEECGVDVKVVPDICQYATSWQCVGDLPVMVIRSEPIPKIGLLLKRMLDVISAALLLFILLPILLAIAILIRVDSPGPAIYKAWRVGKKGCRFKCFKFRTMSVDADKIKHQLRSLNERAGPTFKISDDPRITRIGKWLRKYSLDELPQLVNVLRGEMSLIGPRPHPLDDYNQYQLEHRLRLRVTPGLTGLWQITARLDPSFERNMALDLEYIRNWSVWLDLTILARTVPAVLRGEGR
jgi:exopolysaccharide biosynthesis polyprenyl glycosylphosphotransferase